jgi:hypothetical protein
MLQEVSRNLNALPRWRVMLYSLDTDGMLNNVACSAIAMQLSREGICIAW